MKSEKIKKLLTESRGVSESSILRRYMCTITYEGGVVNRGITSAIDVEDAIMKNYAVLVQQGVDEIVVDISCEEYSEDL